MALTNSTHIGIGAKAVNFSLLDVIIEKNVSLTELQSPKATVVMFLCNHCPYVKHIIPELVSFVKTQQALGIAFIGISSNDVENYPDDSPENMKKISLEHNFSFPYLYDPSQEIAKAYGAQCTPEFYVYDANLTCIYHGQFCDSRPGNQIPVTGHDLENALKRALANDAPIPQTKQKPSLGCNIKWKI